MSDSRKVRLETFERMSPMCFIPIMSIFRYDIFSCNRLREFSRPYSLHVHDAELVVNVEVFFDHARVTGWSCARRL